MGCLMGKRCILVSLALTVTIGIILGFCILPCFAEDITITTYYPAPFSTPSPDTDGVVRFKGISSDPVGANDTEQGALYYNTTDNEFKCHDGVSWQQAFGGESASVMYLRSRSGTAPNACPTGWTQADCRYEWGGDSYNYVRTCYK